MTIHTARSLRGTLRPIFERSFYGSIFDSFELIRAGKIHNPILSGSHALAAVERFDRAEERPPNLPNAARNTLETKKFRV